MELLIIWAVCAFAGYKIAEKNNRDPYLAALLCALFGLIAIIVYLVIGEPKEA